MPHPIDWSASHPRVGKPVKGGTSGGSPLKTGVPISCGSHAKSSRFESRRGWRALAVRMSPEISLKAGRAVLGAGLSSAVARLIHVVVVASGGALLAGGCVGYSLAPEPAAQALAENGSDLADLAARAAAVTASFASEAPARLELTTLSATGAFYDPTQCFTSQREDQSSSKLEVTFDACNGPWGLSNLSGFLTVEPDSDAGLTRS